MSSTHTDVPPPPAPAFPHAPRLWFDRASLEVIRGHLSAGEPTATAIYRLAQARADHDLDLTVKDAADRHDLNEYLTACAMLCALDGNPVYARRAYHGLRALVTPWSPANLTRGSWSLIAAIVHECCYDHWSTEQKLEMTALLVKLARSFREIHPQAGDPHDVTNNHWAVNHAGSLVAALAADGHAADAAGRRWDLADDLAWAAGRTKAFLMHHGDQGLYHEGLGYLAYPASYWLPALLAARRCGTADWLAHFPNLRNLAAALYAAACARPTVSDDDQPSPHFGMKLSWNDDGLGWMRSNPAILMIAIAHPHQRGALRWMYDHLSGVSADRSFCPMWAGWFFSLLYYPYDAPATDPNGVLPRHLTDTRQGLILYRDRYAGPDDALLGAYARATQVGGHQHDDAASLRLMALGHDWILGGGQARSEAEYQSIPTPADGSRPKPYKLGAIVFDEPNEQGGVLGIDHRRCCACYAERYVAVDFSARSGSPVLLAMLDQMDDHLQRAWHWNMTFEPGLTLNVDADQAGFALTAADGANLRARFLGVRPAAIQLVHTPESTRTFQGGQKRRYPGRPIVRAEFTARPHLGIYVVLAVQRGPAPAISLVEHLDVQVGSFAWRRPFGAAVPATFACGTSGTLCRYPSGRVAPAN